MIKQCAICGHDFPAIQKTKIYCSRRCKRIASNRQRQQYYAVGLRRPKAIEITDLKSELVYYISKLEYRHYRKEYTEAEGFLVKVVVASN
jgi:hypothetical protein